MTAVAATPSLPAQAQPPRVSLAATSPTAVADAEVWAVPVLADAGPTALLGPGADAVAEALDLDLVALAEAERATGRAGEVVRFPVARSVAGAPALRVLLLVGVGAATSDDLRAAGASLARAVRGRGVVASTVSTVAGTAEQEAFVAGLVLGSFTFRWRSDAVRPAGHDDPAPAAAVVLAGSADDATARAALERAVAVATAGWRSRTLATVPANLKNPAWLADQATDLAAAGGLDVRVWDETDLARDGFGGILGVGQGSASPPRLVRLEHRPAGRRGRRAPHVVLVGKGITFDSGGLSIKPAQGMSTMKRDMTGGAVVLATMAALRDVGCPVRVTGLVPMAENAVSGSSLRPGDVLRHYGGRTTEVTNTDAEGRLVLADALAYAVDELEPDVLVDVATLTGGVRVALGQRLGGLFATDDALADALGDAGEAAGEPLWRFPLHRGYDDKLASKIADADNGPKGPAAIMAALFLRPFAGDVAWAHLDIASVGDVAEERGEWTVGPSGFGARLLLTWLGSDDPLAGIG